MGKGREDFTLLTNSDHNDYDVLIVDKEECVFELEGSYLATSEEGHILYVYQAGKSHPAIGIYVEQLNYYLVRKKGEAWAVETVHTGE